MHTLHWCREWFLDSEPAKIRPLKSDQTEFFAPLMEEKPQNPQRELRPVRSLINGTYTSFQY